MRVELSDTADLARGAAFLGTGGGGDPYLGRLILEQTFRAGKSPVIISVDELDDDALVIPVGGFGAPTVLTEKLPGLGEGGRVVRALERRMGQKASALMCVEIGGGNALYPTALAAHLGIPIVDADGMGRAFPETQMTTFNMFGQPAAPLVIGDELGSLVTVEASDSRRVEELARPVSVAMGGHGIAGAYAMSGQMAKLCAVRNTLSLSLGIGRAIGRAQREHRDPFDALFMYLKETSYYHHCGQVLDGNVIDVHRETKAGWVIGQVVVENRSAGNRCTVTFRNEFLRAQVDARTIVIVPDLIAILDRETAEPITTERLKYGQRVRVVACSVPPIMRDARALAIWGPAAFGFDEPFVPVEERAEGGVFRWLNRPAK